MTLAVALGTATSVSALSGTQLNAGTGKTLVTFKGGIGVPPVSAGNGQALVADTVNRNIVRGVQPPGQPWAIADFNAKVKADGRITAHGRGLVFAGGDTVGTALVITASGETAASLRVFATVICENVAPFTQRNTAAEGVPLAANGDFTIDDVLSPPPPASCTTPVLLIRNAPGGCWFSAGIQKFAGD
ncbi:MAG TPA: hypothetical protein VHI50_00950 [Micromonosporaceae bacterium]|nr:hypothetical protein [Micromonosporaceae bacterium]